MDIFCAYFDVQGFYINGIFHPAEMCMISKKETFHAKVKKDCNCKPSKEERKSMIYLTANHHGLALTDEGVHFRRMQSMVTKVYHRSKSEPSIYIACKSKESSDLLDYFGLPNVHLNKLNVSHEEIDSERRTCHFHDQSKKIQMLT